VADYIKKGALFQFVKNLHELIFASFERKIFGDGIFGEN